MLTRAMLLVFIAFASLAMAAPMNLPAEQQYLLLSSEDSGRTAVRDMTAFRADASKGGQAPVLDDPNGCVDPVTRERILTSPQRIDHPSVRAFDLDLGDIANLRRISHVPRAGKLHRIEELSQRQERAR